MLRKLQLTASAALLALGLGAVGAQAQFPEPTLGHMTREDVEAARLSASNNPLGDDPAAWEDVDGMANQAFEPEGNGGRANDDNDTAHYARGSTLIIHVFISHDGGTWTSTDRNAAAAKAQVAKEHYLDIAPAEANLRFDGNGTAFWYYSADLNYTIPYSGTDGTVVEDALAQIGFSDADGDGSRVDDMTMYLQNWNGGYDNVIASFESYVNGRAWAAYGNAQIRLYLDSSGNVWAHEMGHSFGACDEYVESGQCNGGIDCGLCQSWYLDYSVNNGNCQLATCPIDVSCLMINNTFTNICDYTRQHWAWWDSDSNGQLDKTKRRVSGSTYTNIWELWHNGYFYWNNVDQGMMAAQKWTSWSVFGLRSPATADYDPYLYADNNHNNYLANSYTGYPVDFIVGDYNHNRLGDEHIEVRRYSGDTANYNLTFESGTGVLYPDGISRVVNWSDYNTVRVWDVPLFAGEEVTFYGWNVSAGVDIGLALFKSNGDTYFAGRTSAVALADAAGAGASESFTYIVPEDDVYGLVAFANTAVNGSFEIQIGPSPATLAEETPFLSAFPLRLFNYDPNAIYWSVVGTRPDAGTDVIGQLFADENYTQLLDESTTYIPGTPEYVAVDYYYAPYNRDYWRVNRTSGAGLHRTEWEHDPELLPGYQYSSWGTGHVVKIWDFSATSGQNYFFREYHSTGSLMDTALYAYTSSNGADNYHGRGDFIGISNYHPAGDGGEWFNVTSPVNGWLGFVMMTQDDNGGSYELMAGPDISMSEDVAVTRSDEMVFASHTIPSSWWTVWGVRPSAGDEASVWLYGDDAYTIGTLAVSDQTGPGVAFVVGDYNHIGSGSTVYPRFWRRSGTGALDMEFEGGGETLSYTPGDANSYDLTWPAGDVAEIWDVYLSDGDQVRFRLEDLSGGMNLGMALFASNGAAYYAPEEAANLLLDGVGPGGEGSFVFTADHSDWYGFVVYNERDNGGSYRVTLQDETTVAVGDPLLPADFGLQAASSNPFADGITLRYSLPSEGPVAIDVFDVTGRRVRSLLNGQGPAGDHLLVWDGRNDAGTAMPGGVYLARLRAGGEVHSAKLVRVQ